MHEAGRITGKPSVILLWNGCRQIRSGTRALREITTLLVLR